MPPGKALQKESQKKRRQYKRSLYGHANLYGLFTDLALRWVKPGGYQGGPEMKRALFEKEGILFDEAGRVVCKRFHYD